MWEPHSFPTPTQHPTRARSNSAPFDFWIDMWVADFPFPTSRTSLSRPIFFDDSSTGHLRVKVVRVPTQIAEVEKDDLPVAPFVFCRVL